MILPRARPNQKVTKQALRILLSDSPLVESQSGLNTCSKSDKKNADNRLSRPQRPYVPTAPTETSSTLDYKRNRKYATTIKQNTDFSRKLQANVIANILATPSRADRLTRYVMSRGTMIRLGVVSKKVPVDEEFNTHLKSNSKKALELVSNFRKESIVEDGFNGYTICKRRYFQSLIPRYVYIIMGMAATSSKIVQQRVRSISNDTLKWNIMNKQAKKRKNPPADASSGLNNQRPRTTFTIDEGIVDIVPQQIFGAILDFVQHRKFTTNRWISLGLKPKGYYFTMAWGQPKQATDLEAHGLCTEVIHIDQVLTQDQSNKLQQLIVSTCPKSYTSIGDKTGFIKVPSSMGIELHMLLWQYKLYETE